MTKIAICLVILLAACVAGCDPTTNPQDEQFLFAKARAAVAFATAELERDTPSEPNTLCDDCNGTGTVPSGDGLARVPCDCGSACRCKPSSRSGDLRPATWSGRETRPQQSDIASASPRRRRLLYFTASWCAACRANEPTFAALANAGWQIGPGDECHVQKIDFDSHPDLVERYGVTRLPAWVLIEDEREVGRCCGVLDPFEVGRLFE